MPLSDYTQQRAAIVLGGQHFAADLCDVIDAGSGSINASTTTRLKQATNQSSALLIQTAVNADSALPDAALLGLKVACRSNDAAREISGQLG